MRIMYALILTGLLVGCCTKKACECDDQTLTIKLVDIAYGTTFTLLVTEKEQYSTVIDTLPLQVSYCSGCTDYMSMSLSKSTIGNRELKDYSFLISAPSENVLDTINRIDYTYFQETSQCNTCLFGVDLITCTAYKEYTVVLNGVTYQERHPALTIRK